MGPRDCGHKADIDRVLQPPRQQRWQEPLRALPIPLEGDLEVERGGRHGCLQPLLYSSGEHPDHTVVIKYVPFVGDSKRALDEYTSKIFMNGTNTIVMHNTCEDSLLATPLIIDLV